MPEKARTYHDYPNSLFRIVEHFQRNPTVDFTIDKESIPPERIQAYVKNFYRFRRQLSEAAAEADTYAESLWQTARNVSVSISGKTKISFYYDILANFEEEITKTKPIEVGVEDEPAQTYDVGELERLIQEKGKNDESSGN